MRIIRCAAAALASALTAMAAFAASSGRPCYNGVYPHLAYYNNEGECGTGAVVPWQGRLWVITYAPHMAHGSSDKLYEIDDSLRLTVRPESVGGTPADRMIHRESGQLIIGPYFIDSLRNVRTMSYDIAPGRYTGAARHLSDPASKVYIATMEEGFYEVDVNSLEVKTLYRDGNGLPAEAPGVNPQNNLLPGCHGKGLYSGQGVLVFANNGEATSEALEKFNVPSGVLAEWDGKDWKVVRRNQFTEITGPGGIYGSADPANDPIYALGWDYRSVILGLRENGQWRFFRLPKASNSYDGAHGWNTEWPRIRDVGEPGNPFNLMTMHGMFWHFPDNFRSGNTSGIEPLSAYLKVVGDFARWNGDVVLGCDDSAQKEFLNTRKIKGGIAGPGQSNSNLWFVRQDDLGSFGPTHAVGAVWLNDSVKGGEASEQMLFGAWPKRSLWLKNDSDNPVTVTLQTDDGSDRWITARTFLLGARSSKFCPLGGDVKGEWARLTADRDARLSAVFSFADNDNRAAAPDPLFSGLAKVGAAPESRGLLYGLGDNRRALGVLSGDGGYYELDGDMNLRALNDTATASFICENMKISHPGMTVDGASVLVVDDKGRRWRLPLGDAAFNEVLERNLARVCREVSTERDLLDCHGTFYELPAENADGFAKIRPVASHDFLVNDYCSYRGLLLMSGVSGENVANDRLVKSDGGRFALWGGSIDDLWKMGKPRGHGGPWAGTPVLPGEYSDPYLIWGYDDRQLFLRHDADTPVTFSVEADPTGEGDWMEYTSVEVQPGETILHHFPANFQARWLRLRSSAPCRATASLLYK